MDYAEDSEIATVVALHQRISAATVSGDSSTFLRHLAPEFMVNSPGNRVLDRDDVQKAFDLGLIHYRSTDTRLEHASLRPNGEVLLMGSETVIPVKTVNADKQVTYRFTELWRTENGEWLLAVRQASIVSVEPAGA